MKLHQFIIFVSLVIGGAVAQSNERVDIREYYTTVSKLDLKNLNKGEACMGQEDYDNNWIAEERPNGFDVFPEDIRDCALACALDSKETELVTCVQKCMNGNSNTELLGKPYSTGCSACFGKLAECTRRKCTADCVSNAIVNTVESYSLNCLTCNEEQCSPDFYECGGIDTTVNLYYTPPTLGGLELVLVVGGACMFALSFGIAGYCKYTSRSRMENAVRLLQQAIGPAPVPPSPWTGENVRHILRKEKRKRGITVDSNEASSKGHLSRPQSFFAGVNLTVVWDFEPQMEDELNVVAGEEITGIRPLGDWWLAQTREGIIGLVPISYVVTDEQKQELLNGNVDAYGDEEYMVTSIQPRRNV